MDGRCVLLGFNWHFSQPDSARIHDYPIDIVRGAYFYTGNSNGQWTLKEEPTSHRWSNANDKNGDTFW
jgi:hypothetical protein